MAIQQYNGEYALSRHTKRISNTWNLPVAEEREVYLASRSVQISQLPTRSSAALRRWFSFFFFFYIFRSCLSRLLFKSLHCCRCFCSSRSSALVSPRPYLAGTSPIHHRSDIPSSSSTETPLLFPAVVALRTPAIYLQRVAALLAGDSSSASPRSLSSSLASLSLP